mgnify:CR=1 FL=1
MKNITRYTLEKTSFLGWRVCVSRKGVMITKYFPDKTYDGKTFTVYKTPESVEEIPNDIGWTVFIRLDFRKGLLDIRVSADGDDWSLLCKGIDVSEYHHNRFGAFLALRPALCSLGSGQAEFDRVVYTSDGFCR